MDFPKRAENQPPRAFAIRFEQAQFRTAADVAQLVPAQGVKLNYELTALCAALKLRVARLACQ